MDKSKFKAENVEDTNWLSLKRPSAFLNVKYVISREIVSYYCQIKRIKVENEICQR
jgi:hypothetical protein